ncbi:MAG TPA: sulfite exporter TauE/SafE family protein [Gaiellaceae bacterium]|nr:sulfite exporter TauE/SafE family protein [Gaiellaceae bacterium]
MDWKLSLAGLLIGALVGMTGMGGGSLMTPLLVFFFGFKPTVAIGTDILHGAIFKSFGAARHRQLGTVHARLTVWMLLASAPCSLVGVGLSTWLKHRYGDGFEDAAGVILGFALIAGGIGFAAKTFVAGRVKSDAPFLLSASDRRIAVATGALGGFVVGLTSVGSGTFFGLVMLLVFPLTASKVVGTDIFHAAALLWVAGAGHLAAGNVDLHATGWLLIGSIPGVLLGSQVSVNLPDRALRLGLAMTLTLAGIKLAEVPGAELVIVAVLSAAALVLLTAGVRRLARGSARPEPAAAEADTTRSGGR